MARKAAVSLEHDISVNELIHILKDLKMEPQYKDFSAIINYVDTMEKQLNTVIGELNSVKQQLDEIKDRQNPVKSACIKMVQSLEVKISETKERLNEVKDSIIKGAKKAVAAFKEKGISALNSALRFLKVKDSLYAIKDDFTRAVASAEKSIAKIDAISSEYHEIGRHIKNMSRAFSGKEAIPDRKPNGKLANVVQLPFRSAKLVRSGAVKGVACAIGKVEKLEQAAEEISKKEKKPSLLQRLEANKELLAETTAVAVDKSKKQESSL